MFNKAHDINVPNIDMFMILGHSPHDIVTNLCHFHVEMFYPIIRMQLQELNDYFLR